MLRLALRRPLDGQTERAYRLLITQVPTEIGASNALTFAVRLNLPLFVTPKNAKAAPVWLLRHGAAGQRELVLANDGNAHIRVGDLRLTAADLPEPVLAVNEAAYVLAGQERSWPLDLKSAALDGPLTVKAETNLGTLEAVVALEGN